MARNIKIHVVYMSIFTLCLVIQQMKLVHYIFSDTNDNTPVVLRSRMKGEHQINIEQTPSIAVDGHVEKLDNKNQANSEVRHFGFLKVHKAGSSTIQNILYRFGLSRNLTFVLPRQEHTLSRAKRQYHNVLPLPSDTNQSGKYDILCNHVVFNINKFNQFLHPDAEYFAIVRKPLDLFISAAYYYRYTWPTKYITDINATNFIHSLIQHPDTYEPANVDYNSRTFNRMTHEFGFVLKSTDIVNHVTEEQFQHFLDSISKYFKTVLVMEMFDESLVLLKRRFHWSIKDIIYLKTNVYQGNITRISANNLTSSDLKAFNRSRWMDIKLYEHFLERFQEQITQEIDFDKEVQCFKKYLIIVQRYCSTSRNVERSKVLLKTQFSESFTVSKEECWLMKLNEKRFYRKLMRRHKAMFPQLFM